MKPLRHFLLVLFLSSVFLATPSRAQVAGSWWIDGEEYTWKTEQGSSNLYTNEGSGSTTNLSYTEHLDGMGVKTGWSRQRWGELAGPHVGVGNPSYVGTMWTCTASTWQAVDTGTVECGTSTPSPVVYTWNETYADAESGSMEVAMEKTGEMGDTAVTLSGWAPYVGSFAGSFTGSYTGLGDVVLDTRTAPSFAHAQLMVDGNLVSFQTGTLHASGAVTDTYDLGSGSVLTIGGSIREFTLGTGDAIVSIDSTGVGYYGAAHGFDVSGHTIEDPSATYPAWFFTSGSSLWVNGTEYPFVSGQRGNHNIVDTFEHAGVGTLTISGTTASTNGTVEVVWNGTTYSGTYESGVFEVEDVIIQAERPEYGPPAFWVAGVYYLRPGSEVNVNVNTYEGPTMQWLTLTPAAGSTTEFVVSGSDGTAAFGGTYETGSGIYSFARPPEIGGHPLTAFAANADGTLQLSSFELPQDLPPGVRVPVLGVMHFLALGGDDRGAGGTWAYYGNAASPGEVLLKMAVNSAGQVVLSDYGALTDVAGSYLPQVHLFQATAPETLPMPICAVDPAANDILWGLPTPPGNRPPSILVGDQIWRYTETDGNGAAVYVGYYPGQMLKIGVEARGGMAPVELTDPYGANDTGTFYNGQFTMDGAGVLAAGDLEGTQTPTSGAAMLQSFAADLDITGNLFSFGSLVDDPNVPGATLQFADIDSVASLHTILARPLAEWTWWENGAGNPLPVMKLSKDHAFSLFDPASGQARIVLDPRQGQMSSLKGNLRVLPVGDIGMGAFTTGPQP